MSGEKGEEEEVKEIVIEIKLKHILLGIGMVTLIAFIVTGVLQEAIYRLYLGLIDVSMAIRLVQLEVLISFLVLLSFVSLPLIAILLITRKPKERPGS